MVSVGTDHHPFDRLVSWADSWAADNRDVDVFVQYGHADPSGVADGAPLLPLDELMAMFERADAIVTHGGPATIMDARRRGLRPIAIPRRPELGEHVDDHQVRFVAHMADRGLVATAATEQEFHGLLDRVCAEPAFLTNVASGWSLEKAVERFGRLVAGLQPRA